MGEEQPGPAEDGGHDDHGQRPEQSFHDHSLGGSAKVGCARSPLGVVPKAEAPRAWAASWSAPGGVRRADGGWPGVAGQGLAGPLPLRTKVVDWLWSWPLHAAAV